MRARVLRWLRVAERPAHPPGAGPSLTMFRASPRYLTVRRLQWALAQFGGLVGIIMSLSLFGLIDLPFFPSVEMNGSTPEGVESFFGRLEQVLGLVSNRVLGVRIDGAQVLLFIESVTIAGYLVQLMVSGLLITLRWEMHWYLVSDESLRIREGLWRLREQTMTVDNIQNMKIRQDPIQRLFGLAELEVHTAGGGGKGDDSESGRDDNLHVGRFRGLDNAWELRNRLRETLNRRQGAGLGDPGDDQGGHTDATGGTEMTRAAGALLAEARALSAAVQTRR